MPEPADLLADARMVTLFREVAHIKARVDKPAVPHTKKESSFDPVLGPREAGEYTGQHGKNLKNAHLRGEIPAVRRSDNGKLGFLLSDLNEYNRRYRRSLQVDADAATDERDWAL